MEIIYFMYMYVILLIITFMMLGYIYIQHNEIFNVAIQFIMIISALSMPFIVGINIITSYKSTQQESAKMYGDNVNFFMSQIFEKFLEHPNMMYMYDEMMGIPNKRNIQRNKNMEVLIGCYIFANCAKVAGYIYESPNDHDSTRIRNWLTKVLGQYLRSPILVSVWTDHYKPKIAGPLLKQFMKDTFSM